MIADKMTNSVGTTIVCNPYHKPLGFLFIKPMFYALKIQEYIQIQDIMLGILQILLGSTTSLLFYVSDMCIYGSLKYGCKNVPKMQEPIKILGTRGVNTKPVPYCGPINIRCPGDPDRRKPVPYCGPMNMRCPGDPARRKTVPHCGPMNMMCPGDSARRKPVPHCGPINMRCPGDPARGICAQLHSDHYFYFFTEVILVDLVDPHL
jgi:hypothetical protein